mmetsp:Transcript_60402/g.124192  ORF Transcript_60402/g.124192 Transcript_60402/m.124192 type:complete len:208 (-) Transcript_60402:1097-1720(-)
MSNTPPPPHLLASVAHSTTPRGNAQPLTSSHIHLVYAPISPMKYGKRPPEHTSASRHHSNSANNFPKCQIGIQNESFTARFFSKFCTAINGLRKFLRYMRPSSTPVHAQVSLPPTLANSDHDALCRFLALSSRESISDNMSRAFSLGMDKMPVTVQKRNPKIVININGPSLLAIFSGSPNSRNTAALTSINSVVHGKSLADPIKSST